MIVHNENSFSHLEPSQVEQVSDAIVVSQTNYVAPGIGSRQLSFSDPTTAINEAANPQTTS